MNETIPGLSQTLTGQERAALAHALTRAESDGAAKGGILKGVHALARVKAESGVSTSEWFAAAAAGFTEHGDKLLCETLSVITRFLSAWGALALLVLGVYQLASTAKSTVSWFWSKLKQTAGMMAGVSPLISGFSSIFHRADMDDDPRSGLSFITSVISAEIPLVGGLFKIFESSPEPTHRGKTATEKGPGAAESIIGTLGKAFEPFASDMGDPLPINHDDGGGNGKRAVFDPMRD